MMTSGYNITDLVREAQIRWLKPGEVLFILQNYEEPQLTHEPPQKPPSGSLFLFNKRVLRFFRKDGHNWRRKKDGRTVGEAHERLKVGNVEALNCYYAHGEMDPSFQRRSYWMLDQGMDHIVLVHYRDITMSGPSSGSVSSLSTGSSTLIQGSSSYASQFTQSTLRFNQFREPYDNTSSPSSVEVSSETVTRSNETSPFSLTEETNGSPNFEIDQALRRIEEQLSLDEENLKDLSIYYSENENGNELGFAVSEQTYGGSGGMQDGLNNYASEQQYPGGYERPNQYQQQSRGEFSVTNQQNSVEEQQKYNSGYTGANNNSSVLLPNELEEFKFPTYTPTRNLSENYPDFYSTLFDQGQNGMPIESNSSLTISQDQKFTIREVSPDWGYASEPTKVLIIGTFTHNLPKKEWYCMFGDTEVPLEIIQNGVFCCYTPPCLPGKVTLCVTSGNRESCSEIREFEYKDKPTNFITNNNNQSDQKSRSSEELLLLVRFVQTLLSNSNQVNQKEEKKRVNVDFLTGSMAGEDSWAKIIEALLDGSLESCNATDWLLEEVLKDKLQQWLCCRLQDENDVFLSKREQGIIHMVSGLGFEWALNPILKSGVGVNFRDINGWTALHWAARFGREKMVAELVASGASAGAVTDPSQLDPTGQTPASIAAKYGHKGLAGYLSEVSLTSHPSLQQLQQPEPSRNNADVAAAITTTTDESDLSLKDTLAAVRNVTQAAARIQSAFRAHSFRKRQLKECNSGDEFGLFGSEISGFSKMSFRNGSDHIAALSIQKKYRGWKGRKDFLALRQKVVKIQAHVRGHQVRKSYRVFCWAVGVVEKVVLRWRRKGVGLRGFKQELGAIDDEDIIKEFRKEKVDVSIDEAVSTVLSMVDSQQARQQYRRMLQKYRQAKAEREGQDSETASTSQGDLMNM